MTKFFFSQCLANKGGCWCLLHACDCLRVGLHITITRLHPASTCVPLLFIKHRDYLNKRAHTKVNFNLVILVYSFGPSCLKKWEFHRDHSLSSVITSELPIKNVGKCIFLFWVSFGFPFCVELIAVDIICTYRSNDLIPFGASLLR